MFCQRCTILQCVTVMCCSGTTLQYVPCCDRSSDRRDAHCSHPHSAAAHLHYPQPQQQPSWVPYTSTNVLMTWIIKLFSPYVALMLCVSFPRTTRHAVWFVSICIPVYQQWKMCDDVNRHFVHRYAFLKVCSFVVNRQHSQSRENINFPEDEVVARSEGGIEEIGESPSPGKMNPHQACSYKPTDGLCQGYLTAPTSLQPHLCINPSNTLCL